MKAIISSGTFYNAVNWTPFKKQLNATVIAKKTGVKKDTVLTNRNEISFITGKADAIAFTDNGNFDFAISDSGSSKSPIYSIPCCVQSATKTKQLIWTGHTLFPNRYHFDAMAPKFTGQSCAYPSYFYEMGLVPVGDMLPYDGHYIAAFVKSIPSQVEQQEKVLFLPNLENRSIEKVIEAIKNIKIPVLIRPHPGLMLDDLGRERGIRFSDYQKIPNVEVIDPRTEDMITSIDRCKYVMSDYNCSMLAMALIRPGNKRIVMARNITGVSRAMEINRCYSPSLDDFGLISKDILELINIKPEQAMDNFKTTVQALLMQTKLSGELKQEVEDTFYHRNK